MVLRQQTARVVLAVVYNFWKRSGFVESGLMSIWIELPVGFRDLSITQGEILWELSKRAFRNPAPPLILKAIGALTAEDGQNSNSI